MPETDAVDHTAFDLLRRDIERARRRRGLWVVAVIAAVPVAFVSGWSAAVGAFSSPLRFDRARAQPSNPDRAQSRAAGSDQQLRSHPAPALMYRL